MKKLIILSALLVAAPMFAIAGTNKFEPHTAVPVVKNDKNHPDQKAHVTAQEKHTQKSKEDYLKELQAKITEATAFVASKKDTASADQLAQAAMKISIAEQWLKTIESYQDPITRYVRSFNYGIGEIKSAKFDLKIKKKQKEISEEEVKVGLAKLAHESEMLLKEKESITFHAENDACFKMILKSAYDYIQLATKPENKANFTHLSKRAHKYIVDGRKFLKAHKPHDHKHAGHASKHATHNTKAVAPRTTTSVDAVTHQSAATLGSTAATQTSAVA